MVVDHRIKVGIIRTPKECQKEANSHGLNFFLAALSRCLLNEGATDNYQIGLAAQLHSYLGGIVRRMNGVAETVGGVEDHVHLLMSLRPVHCVAHVMRDLKKDSTNWVKENFERRFAWQEGYATFTVGPSATDAVRHYIANQETHHAKSSYMDELKELLGKAGIAYEEKYLL